MKILLRSTFAAVLICGLAAPVFAGDLKLVLQNGRATVIAHDVPVRQILEEWARVGGTRIMNADKVAGAPVTLQLVDVPESEALDTLLRSVAGYMAAPRPAGLMGASLYDRIMILPTSHPPAATASVAPQPFQRMQPQPQPMPQPEVQPDPDDDDEPVNVPSPMPMPNPNGNPAVSPFPGAQPNPNANPAVPVGPFPGPQAMPMQQPQQVQPQPGQALPVTSPRPGAIPVPQNPNGVPNPYQPSVVRPVGPGGPEGPGN
jgi:gamma-aminobutyric acid receptor subunit epsilon